MSKRIPVVIIVVLGVMFIYQCGRNTATPSNQNIELTPTLRFAAPLKTPPMPEFKSLLSEEQAIAKYREYYKKLNLNNNKELADIAKSLGEPEIRSGNEGAPVYDANYRTMVYNVGNSVIMSIDAQDGRLLWLGNNVLLEKKDREPFPQKIITTKTKGEIIKLAEKYRQIIMGDLPKGFSFAPPDASFKSERDLRGMWSVKWQRLINGYVIDSIAVSICEPLGCELCTFHNIKMYPLCPTDVKISEKEAEAIAWLIIPESRETNPLMHEAKDYIIKEKRLEICSFEYDYEYGALPYPSPGHYLRLAYEFEFDCQKYPRGGFRIWIDAATGEVLRFSPPF